MKLDIDFDLYKLPSERAAIRAALRAAAYICDQEAARLNELFKRKGAHISRGGVAKRCGDLITEARDTVPTTVAPTKAFVRAAAGAKKLKATPTSRWGKT